MSQHRVGYAQDGATCVPSRATVIDANQGMDSGVGHRVWLWREEPLTDFGEIRLLSGLRHIGWRFVGRHSTAGRVRLAFPFVGETCTNRDYNDSTERGRNYCPPLVTVAQYR